MILQCACSFRCVQPEMVAFALPSSREVDKERERELWRPRNNMAGIEFIMNWNEREDDRTCSSAVYRKKKTGCGKNINSKLDLYPAIRMRWIGFSERE